jgi:hypothetical protein
MREFKTSALTILCLLTSLPIYGQHIGAIEHRLDQTWTKAENGLILSFRSGIWKDASVSQINIADGQGRSLLDLNVLRAVPEADGVSVYDVSARPSQLVSVAAVFTKGQGVRPADTLLLYDFQGNLLSALALEPSREIDALEIDDQLNIWTVTAHADEKDPSTVPLVVEYSQNGKVIRELLPRKEFPLQAEIIKQNPTIGPLASGCAKGVFWFWLPGSTDLVAIRTSDGAVTRMQTGLPSPSNGHTLIPLRFTRDDFGEVVAEMREEGQNVKPRLAYYAWSPETKSWSGFTPETCPNQRVIGVTGEDVYFVSTSAADICLYKRPH